MNKRMAVILALRDFFFPRRCGFCGQMLPYLCRCERCADLRRRLALPQGSDLTPTDDKDFRFVDRFAAAYYYEDAARGMILRFKFDRDAKYKWLFFEMARETAACYFDAPSLADADFVVCVPDSGVDDIRYVRAVSLLIGKPFYPRLLRKTKKTYRQHQLSDEARRKNLVGAFAAVSPKKIKGKKIVVCDDVSTTGSTLDETARALKAAGAAAVYGLCLCTAVGCRKNDGMV